MRVLIVDDDPIKREYWKLFIQDEIQVGIAVSFAQSYAEAMALRGVFFNVLVVDFDLRSENTGEQFLREYLPHNKGAIGLLYSAFPEETGAVGCLDMRQVERLLIHCLKYDNPPLQEEYRMAPHTASIALPFSEKLCDERHAKDKEEHLQIKSYIEKYEKANEKEHGSIEAAVDKFDKKIELHNSKVFWVIVTGVGAQVITTMTIIIFVLTMMSKVKIGG